MKLPLSILVLAAACGGSDKTTTTTTTTTTARAEPVMIEEEAVAQTVPEEPAPAETAPAPEAPPVETPPVATLDKDMIRRVIRGNLAKIRYCYEQELMKQPGLQGTTTVTFTVTPSGQVESAIGAGLDATVDLCVANVIAALVFPPSVNGTQVNYPFKFQTDGGAAVGSPVP
jgi:hypothetical protein